MRKAKRNMNPWWISGWSYIGRILLERFSPEMQKKLKMVGSAVTIEEKDRYIRYVNNGLVTASSKKPMVDFHRIFKRGGLSG